MQRAWTFTGLDSRTIMRRPTGSLVRLAQSFTTGIIMATMGVLFKNAEKN